MNIVERLRNPSPPNIQFVMYEWMNEAADEIEQLREALNCVILYWDEWKDASDNHPTALSLEEVVLIARDSLKEEK